MNENCFRNVCPSFLRHPNSYTQSKKNHPLRCAKNYPKNGWFVELSQVFPLQKLRRKTKKNARKVDDEHLDDELVPFILQALPTSRPLSIYILGGLSDCKMIIRGCQTCILMHKPKSQSLLHNPTNLLFLVCQAWSFFVCLLSQFFDFGWVGFGVNCGMHTTQIGRSRVNFTKFDVQIFKRL